MNCFLIFRISFSLFKGDLIDGVDDLIYDIPLNDQSGYGAEYKEHPNCSVAFCFHQDYEFGWSFRTKKCV